MPNYRHLSISVLKLNGLHHSKKPPVKFDFPSKIAKGGQKVVEAASEELKELYRQIFIPITENLEGSGGLL